MKSPVLVAFLLLQLNSRDWVIYKENLFSSLAQGSQLALAELLASASGEGLHRNRLAYSSKPLSVPSGDRQEGFSSAGFFFFPFSGPGN
jgi:hypothetical protein